MYFILELLEGNIVNEEFNSQNNGHVNLNKSSPEYANNQNNGAVNSICRKSGH